MSTFVRNIGLKRRKSVKSRGIKRGPEIKQKDFFTATQANDAWAIVPFAEDLEHRTTRPFKLIEMSWPSVGTYYYNRVGNKINMRWIRFKGYACVYDRLISNCRLKFYLVRCYGRSVADANFGDLFKNWETVNYDVTNVWTIMNHMRHNYYKAIVDIDKVGRNKGIVISKLGEIKLNASSHSMNARIMPAHTENTTGTTGQGTNETTSVPQVPMGKSFEFESVDNIPIDLKISLYETIDCTVDHYYLYIMEDYPYTTNNTVKQGTFYPQPTKDSGFELNFFGRYYYTDA